MARLRDLLRGEPQRVRPAKVQARASRLRTDELLEWADASLYNVGRGLSEYRKSHPPDIAEKMLDLATNEADVLVVLLEEIRSRVGRR